MDSVTGRIKLVKHFWGRIDIAPVGSDLWKIISRLSSWCGLVANTLVVCGQVNHLGI